MRAVMGNFILDDEVTKEIADKIKIDKSKIKALNYIYKDISKKMKTQYLAHLIRTVEEIVRERKGFEKFAIRCIPFLNDNAKAKRYGLGHFYENDKTYYIFYSSKIDERFTRVVIVHELGHLMTEMLKDKIGDTKNAEPYATVLGILAIMDKNDFYSNKQNFLLHKSCNEIIDDFTLL